MQHEQRLQFLSLLRVIATGAVVFGHAASFFGGFAFTQWPNFPYIQNIAVTVFFCISGYIIAWVCDCRREGGGLQVFAKFVFDRVSRLGIPLFPFLVLCAIAERIILGSTHPDPLALSARSFIGNLLFLQWLTPQIGPIEIPLGVQPFGLNRALWTLALEFWTYILFAGAFYGLSQRRSKVVPLLAAASAGLIMGAALYKGQGNGLPLIWLLGATTYFVLKRLPPVTTAVRILAIILFMASFTALLVPAAWPGDGGYTKVYNLLIFLCFLMSIIAASGEHAITPSARAIDFTASFAYSTYIVHYPILYIVHNFSWLPNGNFGAILGTGLAVFAGWTWSLLFERHYKTIREFLWNGAIRVLKTMSPAGREPQ